MSCGQFQNGISSFAPSLSDGLLPINFKTNQVVNYQYTSLSALGGVNFVGDLNVVGKQGSTQYVVGYLYGGGAASMS